MQRTENLLKIALDAFRKVHEKAGIQEKSQAKITRKLLIEHGFSVSKEQYTNSRQINFEEKKKEKLARKQLAQQEKRKSEERSC